MAKIYEPLKKYPWKNTMLAVHRLIEESELHFELILGLGPCRVKTKMDLDLCQGQKWVRI